jgi:hypothetical protein
MTNVFAFPARDGSCTFVCTDCGCTVHSFADFETDCNVCRTCQYLSEHPQTPKDIADLLRGTPDDERRG